MRLRPSSNAASALSIDAIPRRNSPPSASRTPYARTTARLGRQDLDIRHNPGFSRARKRKMIERSWDRRPCGIRAYPHLIMTPPFVLLDPVAGRTSKRPISVYTALSELRFVSEEDEDTFSPLDPDSNPCQLSPVSQLQFASPEEAMTLVTESTEPSSHAPSPLFPTPYPSSTGVREEQARINPSEQLPSTACTRSPSLRRPGWPTPKPDGFVTSGPMRVRRRPLPEVPEHPQPRPLPPTPRPTEAVTVPHLPDSQGVSCSPRKEFIYDPLGDPLAPSRPASESERDARNQSVEGERPKPDPTPEDIPPALQSLTPAVTSLPTSSPPPNAFGSPPAPTIPIILPIVPKPIYPAPILPDLLSPTSIDLVTAAGLTITGENGQQLFFGALFRDRKVIVILIRHFWCLFCRNYVRSISNIVTPEILRKRGVDLVLIGNGAPGMIKAYKSAPSVVLPIQSTKLILSDFRITEISFSDVYGFIASVTCCPRVIQNQ